MKHYSKGRNSVRAEQAADWIARFRSSGMTLRRFAQVHGLKPGRLRYWVYQKRRPRVCAPARVPGKFVEVKAADFLGGDRWAVEIALSEDLTVRFGEGIAPSWMGEVIEAVRPLC